MLETLADWHPFIVHFAVAFTIGSAAFDIIDFFFPHRRFEETALMLVFAALPFLLFAVLTGNLAEPRVGTLSASAQAALERHMTYANIAVWVFSAVGLWRIFLHVKKQYSGGRKIAYVFIVTAVAMSVYLAALYGGSIRHDLLSVTPDRNHALMPVASAVCDGRRQSQT